VVGTAREVRPDTVASLLSGPDGPDAAPVRAGGPDTIAIFAIRPDRTDIGGCRGSSSREIDNLADGRITLLPIPSRYR
jgi:hypothetical protein